MILEDETYDAFGYYLKNLKHKSRKLIITACELCGEFRICKKCHYHTFCSSCTKKGENNPNYRKIFSDEYKAKLSAAHKGKTHTDETKAKMSVAQKGNTNALGFKRTVETKAKDSAAAIKRIHNSPPSRTAPEKAFEAICIKNNLPFICNVNAKQHIGNSIPDFVHTSKKIVVEVFGNYYHSAWRGFKNLRYNHTVEGRTEQLKAEGYKCIVLWESDLKRSDAEAFVMHLMHKEKII